MIVQRDWTSDLYAFHCMAAMDAQGVRIVALIPPCPAWQLWRVVGQADVIDFDRLDRETQERMEGS